MISELSSALAKLRMAFGQGRFCDLQKDRAMNSSM